MSAFVAEIITRGNEVVVPIPKIAPPSLFGLVRDAYPTRKWDGRSREWIFPLRAEQVLRGVLESLTPQPAAAEPKPENIISLAFSEAARPASPTLPDGFVWPGEFKPYSHQPEGVARLLSHPQYLLAWEMGCGKSAPIAAAIRHLIDGGECKRALIACPKTLLNVWRHELWVHGRLDCVVVAGPKAKRASQIASVQTVVVTSYETARDDYKAFVALNFDTVVCDEAHRIKNSTSATSKGIRRISLGAKRRWALSGTPAPNGPLDWFGTLLYLGEQHAGTTYKTQFERRYAVYGGEIVPGVRKVISYRDLDDLHRRIGNVSHALRKTECLDLPEKQFQSVPVELGPKAAKLYATLRKEAIARLESGEEVTAANVLTEALRLLQVCGGHVKTDDGGVQPVGDNAKIEALEDLLEDIGPEEPVIIWCAFRHEAEAIKRQLVELASLHHGGMTTAERDEAIRQFKDGERQYLVTTTPSLREGHTLTRAATSIYYSRAYSLTDWLQSQDRIHRIGQNRTVRIVSLVAAGTVDEKVAKALESKKELHELLLSGLEEVL